jgi:hypothetical protein
MTRERNIRTPAIAGVLLWAGLSAVGRAQNCGNGPTIAIAADAAAPLDFGSVIAGASLGTVVISPAGARSSTGGVFLTGATFGAAGLDVQLCGQIGVQKFTVTVQAPSVTISNGSGGTMTVDTFKGNPTLGTSVAGSTQSGVRIWIGATLRVAANQAPGLYAGTFTVIVNRP